MLGEGGSYLGTKKWQWFLAKLDGYKAGTLSNSSILELQVHHLCILQERTVRQKDTVRMRRWVTTVISSRLAILLFGGEVVCLGMMALYPQH